jgi:hypothetical protein
MTKLFGREVGQYRQGFLFDTPEPGFAAINADADSKRRPGETAVDYRIRRQYRDVAATAPLFPAHRR